MTNLFCGTTLDYQKNVHYVCLKDSGHIGKHEERYLSNTGEQGVVSWDNGITKFNKKEISKNGK